MRNALALIRFIRSKNSLTADFDMALGAIGQRHRCALILCYTEAVIRVYPLPPQLPTSPYLDQLYAPMSALGVDVVRVRPRYALPALLLGRGPRILHLHFFDELTQRRGQVATAARSLLFLALLAILRWRGV